jgi:hypothetical protein
VYKELYYSSVWGRYHTIDGLSLRLHGGHLNNSLQKDFWPDYHSTTLIELIPMSKWAGNPLPFGTESIYWCVSSNIACLCNQAAYLVAHYLYFRTLYFLITLYQCLKFLICHLYLPGHLAVYVRLGSYVINQLVCPFRWFTFEFKISSINYCDSS